MILSDREIKAAIARGFLKLDPEPKPEHWSSTAIDLTLDAELRVWEPGHGSGVDVTFCPGTRDFNYTEVAEKHTRRVEIPEHGHVLEPKAFVLGWTIEKVQLPHTSRLAARVEGKSSLARLGLGVHVTAPTIHAGFGYRPPLGGPGNPIQLEIWNVGTLRIKLTKGLPICQLIFEEVHGTPEKGYAGMFAKQGASKP